MPPNCIISVSSQRLQLACKASRGASERLSSSSCARGSTETTTRRPASASAIGRRPPPPPAPPPPLLPAPTELAVIVKPGTTPGGASSSGPRMPRGMFARPPAITSIKEAPAEAIEASTRSKVPRRCTASGATTTQPGRKHASSSPVGLAPSSTRGPSTDRLSCKSPQHRFQEAATPNIVWAGSESSSARLIEIVKIPVSGGNPILSNGNGNCFHLAQGMDHGLGGKMTT
mmetsp:Transcript_158329/g.507785  ORF Transcript_158329/g.507785 Transcript_158329/m.507785 type:complete len:230 (+) Transcript_158329:147-836(+)